MCLAIPTICVEDSAEVLALYIPTGAEFCFPAVTKAGHELVGTELGTVPW